MLKIALIGFGTVGQGFVELLSEKQQWLKKQHNLDIQLVAIAGRSKGSVMDSDGLEPGQLLTDFRRDRNLNRHACAVGNKDSLSIIAESPADIMIEATPTELKSAQPAFNYMKLAFETGKHVVTCNKGPLVRNYNQLLHLANQNNVSFRFEGTVMSGTPVLNTAQENLAGASITGIRGILNGTTNYMLSQMENGFSYADSLRKAQQLGYAETDPAGDVDGWDTLAKVVILANVLLPANLKLEDIPCQGISGLTQVEVGDAVKSGFRWKLLGEIKRESGLFTANVAPQKVPLTDPLAHISLTANAITYETDVLGPVTIVGAGAGGKETAFALLNDVIHIARKAKVSG